MPKLWLLSEEGEEEEKAKEEEMGKGMDKERGKEEEEMETTLTSFLQAPDTNGDLYLLLWSLRQSRRSYFPAAGRRAS